MHQLQVKDKRMRYYVLVTLVIGLFLSGVIGMQVDQYLANRHGVVQGTRDSSKVYRVHTVLDGDTFTVKVGSAIRTVRLIAVDAPESKHPTLPVQCFSHEAKTYLDKLIKGKTVTLENEPLDNDTDRYNRLLRYAFIDGVNVNEALVLQGYAIEKTYVNNYKYQQLFKQAQVTAQRHRVGLWSLKTCNGDVNFGTYLSAQESSMPTQLRKCNCSKSCAQLTTCADAMFQLQVCKCSGRDTDLNGVPCENLCN